MAMFRMEKYRSGYTGGSVEEARALFAIANELRLKNYIDLLKMANTDGLNTEQVKNLIQELESS